MKSKRRDDIYNPQSKRYDRIKHSRKLKWEAKAQLDAGQITERQYRLLIKKAELVLTGQWQHKDSDFAPRLNRVEFVQEYDKDAKKSVLSTDVSKTQLPISEREKQANKRAIATLAVKLFKQDYPDSEVKLTACEPSVVKQYIRRAKYQILNTQGINRVTPHNPNAVKPLKKRKEYTEKVSVTITPEVSLESKSVDAPKTKKSLKPKSQTRNVASDAEKLYQAENPGCKFTECSDAIKMNYYKRVV